MNVVWLYVRDVARSAAFYGEVLGVPVEGDDEWAEGRFPDGTRFGLHRATNGEPRTPNTVVVDFEVEDIDRAVAGLRAAGVRTGEISREPYGSSCEFVDPDGYRLNVYQPPVR